MNNIKNYTNNININNDSINIIYISNINDLNDNSNINDMTTIIFIDAISLIIKCINTTILIRRNEE